MEVNGTNKSLYFDADTFAKAQELMRARGQDSLSKLVRDLICEKHAQIDRVGKAPSKPSK